SLRQLAAGRRVEQQIDFAAADDVDHVGSAFADLVHTARRDAQLVQKVGRSIRCYKMEAQLVKGPQDLPPFVLVLVGQRGQYAAVGGDDRSRRNDRLVESLRVLRVDAEHFSGRFHLRSQ